MKRLISILLAALMLLSLVGCGAQGNEPVPEDETELPEVAVEVPNFTAAPLDLAAIMDEVCQARYEEICTPIEEGDFSDYLVDDPSTANLLSDEEIALLVDLSSKPVAGTLTAEEALADVSLLFRALHSGYGAYYYFGEENFVAAENSLVQWIGEQGENVNTDELKRKIVSALSFVEDAHFNIHDDGNINNWDDSAIRWEYFYCDGFEFERDENGFYQIDDSGTKWTVSAISDDRVRIERTLMPDGRIVYAPVLFCTRPSMENSTITLMSESGESKEYDLVWKESEPGEYGDIYRLIQCGDITYLSVQDFDRDLKEQLGQYVADAALMRDNKAIIYDLRSNRGGASSWSREWVANYLNISEDAIQLKGLFSNRSSRLFDVFGYDLSVQHGYYDYNVSSGVWHENDIPIIVLTDDRCSSSGESALLYLKALDNVLVIGSNSAGYQICGNVKAIRLPASQLVVQFGCSFHFMERLINIDYRGYEPDVWCDPADALDAVMNMLSYYGLAEAEELALITEELNTYHEITLKMPWGEILQSENSFGTGDEVVTFTVLADGEEFSDFTVESGDLNVCTVEKNDNATFTLYRGAPGDSWLTITCGKSVARFRWHAE